MRKYLLAALILIALTAFMIGIARMFGLVYALAVVVVYETILLMVLARAIMATMNIVMKHHVSIHNLGEVTEHQTKALSYLRKSIDVLAGRKKEDPVHHGFNWTH